MFNPNADDLQFLFNSAGQTVLINDVTQQAIITLPPLSDNDERFIHTFEKVNMGDIVAFDDNKYLIMTETISLRNGKYKAKMRHCNYIIQVPNEIVREFVGYDNLGKPVYRDVVVSYFYIPAIVQNKSFTFSGGQLLVAENQILITVQDNEVNRVKFATNNTFDLISTTWKVRHLDYTRKGLIYLTCEYVS